MISEETKRDLIIKIASFITKYPSRGELKTNMIDGIDDTADNDTFKLVMEFCADMLRRISDEPTN